MLTKKERHLHVQNGVAILLTMRWVNKISYYLKKSRLGWRQKAVILLPFCGVSNGTFFISCDSKNIWRKKGKDGQWLEEERCPAGKKTTARLGKLFPTGELWIKEEKWGQFPRSYRRWLQIAASLQNHFFFCLKKKRVKLCSSNNGIMAFSPF